MSFLVRDSSALRLYKGDTVEIEGTINSIQRRGCSSITSIIKIDKSIFVDLVDVGILGRVQENGTIVPLESN
jgi:hypothetical protein